MLTKVSTWKEVARAEGEVVSSTGFAHTFVDVSKPIDPGWLIELGADAVIDN